MMEKVWTQEGGSDRRLEYVQTLPKTELVQNNKNFFGSVKCLENQRVTFIQTLLKSSSFLTNCLTELYLTALYNGSVFNGAVNI
jgi:hypothetical protein